MGRYVHVQNTRFFLVFGRYVETNATLHHALHTQVAIWKRAPSEVLLEDTSKKTAILRDFDAKVHALSLSLTHTHTRARERALSLSRSLAHI
jgi:hypothetical protein